MKAYQAYAKGGFSVTAENPHDAAYKFFQEFPNKRKCNIIEGDHKDGFFTITYGPVSNGEWPKSYKDITRASLRDLIGVTA
jgi:hypothetical protein